MNHNIPEEDIRIAAYFLWFHDIFKDSKTSEHYWLLAESRLKAWRQIRKLNKLPPKKIYPLDVEHFR